MLLLGGKVYTLITDCKDMCSHQSYNHMGDRLGYGAIKGERACTFHVYRGGEKNEKSHASAQVAGWSRIFIVLKGN